MKFTAQDFRQLGTLDQLAADLANSKMERELKKSGLVLIPSHEFQKMQIEIRELRKAQPLNSPPK